MITVPVIPHLPQSVRSLRCPRLRSHRAAANGAPLSPRRVRAVGAATAGGTARSPPSYLALRHKAGSPEARQSSSTPTSMRPSSRHKAGSPEAQQSSSTPRSMRPNSRFRGDSSASSASACSRTGSKDRNHGRLSQSQGRSGFGPRAAWSVTSTSPSTFDAIAANEPETALAAKWGPREQDFREFGRRLEAEARAASIEQAQRASDGRHKRQSAEDFQRSLRHISSGQPWRDAPYSAERRFTPRHVPAGYVAGRLFSEVLPLDAPAPGEMPLGRRRGPSRASAGDQDACYAPGQDKAPKLEGRGLDVTIRVYPDYLIDT